MTEHVPSPMTTHQVGVLFTFSRSEALDLIRHLAVYAKDDEVPVHLTISRSSDFTDKQITEYTQVLLRVGGGISAAEGRASDIAIHAYPEEA
jgi:hypothetical protein